MPKWAVSCRCYVRYPDLSSVLAGVRWSLIGIPGDSENPNLAHPRQQRRFCSVCLPNSFKTQHLLPYLWVFPSTACKEPHRNGNYVLFSCTPLFVVWLRSQTLPSIGASLLRLLFVSLCLYREDVRESLLLVEPSTHTRLTLSLEALSSPLLPIPQPTGGGEEACAELLLEDPAGIAVRERQCSTCTNTTSETKCLCGAYSSILSMSNDTPNYQGGIKLRFSFELAGKKLAEGGCGRGDSGNAVMATLSSISCLEHLLQFQRPCRHA